jgi:hypothetical protein
LKKRRDGRLSNEQKLWAFTHPHIFISTHSASDLFVSEEEIGSKLVGKREGEGDMVGVQKIRS